MYDQNELGAIFSVVNLERITANGYRLTSQRRVLIETIQGGQQHLDAATLLKLAVKRDPRINRATVYRTLSLLKKLQLVDELGLMHLEGEKHFYEIKPDRQHVHLACGCCGAITEFSSETFEQLKNEIAEQTALRFK
ncbi:MAG: Fur family transcriptional regulator [Candidatus Dormibacteraceae bacterium]